MVIKKTPNPIDVHVGSRIRMRRMMLSLSQEKLGEALGVTFQQVQKYEKGTNRVGASRLQAISGVLQVPPSYFFENAPGGPEEGEPGFAEAQGSYVVDFLTTSEGLALTKAFTAIRDPIVRRRMIDLMQAVADSGGGAERG